MLMVVIGYRALKTKYDTPWRLSREIDLTQDSEMSRSQIIELDGSMKQEDRLLYSEEEFFETDKACIIRYVRLFDGFVSYNEWRRRQGLSHHASVDSLMLNDLSLDVLGIKKWINVFPT